MSGQSPDDRPAGAGHHVESEGLGGVAYADDERIVAHVGRFWGADGTVIHELVSDRVHIDVHVMPPTGARPAFLLVTSGMSALPMATPAEIEKPESWRFAELCMLLPAYWRFSDEDLRDERWWWPIRLLKSSARLPHDNATWLGWGHSIPHHAPPEPYAPGTELAGVMLIPPFELGADFFGVPGEPPLHIFQLLPVTSREMDLKLRSGSDALLEALEAALPSPYGPVDPTRASVV